MIDYVFQQLKPMKARGKFQEMMYTSPDYVEEIKYDGHRMVAQACREGTRFTSDHPAKSSGLFVENTDSLPHLFKPVPALFGTALDGEAVTDLLKRSKSNKVTTIMGASSGLAISRQQTAGWLQFAVFDCLFFKGKDIRNRPLEERQQYLFDAIKLWNNPYVSPVIGTFKGKKAFYDEAIRNGHEGTIFKSLSSRYGNPNDWVKRKHTSTFDMVVMGFNPARETSKKVTGEISETKYKGQIGTIKIGQYVMMNGKLVLTPYGKCSGIDDSLRLAMTRNPTQYIGTVIEVTAQERNPSGLLREPRYSRPRPDKRPEDCIYNPNES
mgnify:CR=1 FL=1